MSPNFSIHDKKKSSTLKNSKDVTKTLIISPKTDMKNFEMGKPRSFVTCILMLEPINVIPRK